jgi:cysteinyl-tRNA synthetase
MALQIYNVLGREKQEFRPLEEGKINMYVCGPTVYDHPHIGHGKSYVSFDVVTRYLRYSGYDVLYVQNITDVGHLLDDGEDRILKKARQSASKPMQIVETYTRSFYESMDALNVHRPDINPRASGHIPEQIAMIQTLLAKGHAYEVEGNVYFDVTSFPDYGKLSNQRLEQHEDGSREHVRDEKRHPADFALWKRAEAEHILQWDSPWGWGFPGWHIECSAMAAKYLGQTFDIHGGGIDNIFPHNECEIAQSEAAHGQPFANYWMLVGSLMVPEPESNVAVKMSKSLGNFITLRDALQTYPGEVLRTLVLSSHYSSTLIFTPDSFDAAKNGWERLMGAVRLTRQLLPKAPEGDAGNGFLSVLASTEDKFRAAMDDDFNAPQALATLYDLTREVNQLLNSDTVVGQNVLRAIDECYLDLGGRVLGIVPENLGSSVNAEREAGLIQLLIDLRKRARESKNFAESDRIRAELAAMGVVLEDRADGTIWKYS